MRIIFCDSVIDRKQVEPMYEAEWEAAIEAGHEVSLISHEALADEQNLRKAIALVKAAPEPQTAMYRGWMFRPEQYQQLYEGLLAKNLQLINSPEQYQHCHYFPESWSLIQAVSPASYFVSQAELGDKERIRQALSQISGPAIIKDYVKSLKHFWEEACFIPDAADWVRAEKVIDRFLELQGDSLNGGLVIRQFVQLKQLTEHSKSGMPLAEEYRLFVKDGQVLQQYPYWEEGDYAEAATVPENILAVLPKIQSPFFTADMARLENGEWVLIELGDAQVAGLPERADVEQFYQSLR